VCAVAGWIAYRDVKLSAELMLWIEVVSVSLISSCWRAGVPLRLSNSIWTSSAQGRFSALGPALVLSMFSFVGFESATTLGGEAREPLRPFPAP
jgi:amino acid transporter